MPPLIAAVPPLIAAVLPLIAARSLLVHLAPYHLSSLACCKEPKSPTTHTLWAPLHPPVSATQAYPLTTNLSESLVWAFSLYRSPPAWQSSMQSHWSSQAINLISLYRFGSKCDSQRLPPHLEFPHKTSYLHPFRMPFLSAWSTFAQARSDRLVWVYQVWCCLTLQFRYLCVAIAAQKPH